MVRKEAWEEKNSKGTSPCQFLHFKNGDSTDLKILQNYLSEINPNISVQFNEETKNVEFIIDNFTFNAGTEFFIQKTLSEKKFKLLTISNMISQYVEIGPIVAEEKPLQEDFTFTFNRELLPFTEANSPKEIDNLKVEVDKIESYIQQYLHHDETYPVGLFNTLKLHNTLQDMLINLDENYYEINRALYEQFPAIFKEREESGKWDAFSQFKWEVFGEDAIEICWNAFKWVDSVENKIKSKEEGYTEAGMYSTQFNTHQGLFKVLFSVEPFEVENPSESSVYLILCKEIAIGNEYR